MNPDKKARPNILYVDDIETNLILFDSAFQNDYNVFLAGSGKEALELLRKEQIAVIITDQRMPEMSGTDLLEIVQQEFPAILRFMLTAYSDYQTVVDSINKGQIYGFFNKPFDVKDMKVSLDKAVEVYNLRESNRQMVIEIERVNKDLKRIDKSKTAFLNMITGELRTPINKIMSVVHMLKDSVASTDLAELVNYLDTSVSKLEKFATITNQLARLNDIKAAVKWIDVSVRELIEISILEKKDLLNSTGKGIYMEKCPTELRIKGDYELLLTCLTILLDNSISHAEKDSKLNISCGENDVERFIRIDFKENFTEKMLQNILNHFNEEENPEDYHVGVELMLAKQIMTAHNGRIQVNHREEGSISLCMAFPPDNMKPDN